MELTPGIHKIDSVKGANSYLVIDKGIIIIIDTGMPGNGKKITDYIEGLGKGLQEVEYIVLTHADIDHSGSVSELREMTGAKVAIHQTDAPRLAGEKELKKVTGFIGLVFKLMMRLKKFQPVKPDILLKDGDKIGDLSVVYTPGHTEGSISLYKAGEVIFVGDALMSDKDGNLRLPLSVMTLDMARAKKSIKKISELEFKDLLPGHGKPVLQNASEKVKDLSWKEMTHRN